MSVDGPTYRHCPCAGGEGWTDNEQDGEIPAKTTKREQSQRKGEAREGREREKRRKVLLSLLQRRILARCGDLYLGCQLPGD